MKRKNILFAVLLLGCVLCVGFFIKSNIQQVDASSAYEEEETRVLDSVYTCPKCGGRMIETTYVPEINRHQDATISFESKLAYVDDSGKWESGSYFYEYNGENIPYSLAMCKFFGANCYNPKTVISAPYHLPLSVKCTTNIKTYNSLFYCESCLYAAFEYDLRYQ